MKSTNPIKEKMLGALGGAGMVLWYFISVILVLAPLLVLGLPWWAYTLVFIAINIPLIGSFAMFGTWVWSLIFVINNPVNLVILIIYIVTAALYVFVDLIPRIIDLFGTVFSHNKDEEDYS